MMKKKFFVLILIVVVFALTALVLVSKLGKNRYNINIDMDTNDDILLVEFPDDNFSIIDSNKGVIYTLNPKNRNIENIVQLPSGVIGKGIVTIDCNKNNSCRILSKSNAPGIFILYETQIDGSIISSYKIDISFLGFEQNKEFDDKVNKAYFTEEGLRLIGLLFPLNEEILDDMFAKIQAGIIEGKGLTFYTDEELEVLINILHEVGNGSIINTRVYIGNGLCMLDKADGGMIDDLKMNQLKVGRCTKPDTQTYLIPQSFIETSKDLVNSDFDFGSNIPVITFNKVLSVTDDHLISRYSKYSDNYNVGERIVSTNQSGETLLVKQLSLGEEIVGCSFIKTINYCLVSNNRGISLIEL